MDYEKKYNEALERARKVHRNYKNLFPEDSYSEDIEIIFPELRESEDERVRKWLIDCVKAKHDCYFETVTREQVLSYIEKQKGLDKMIVVSPEVWDNAISDAFENGKKEGEKQKEQKPVDEPFEEWIDSWYKEHCSPKHGLIHMNEKEFKNWSRGIRNMFEQKPAEWSEDTKKRIKIIAEFLRYKGYEDDAELIESLRPQPKQEWSEEDKKMLESIISLVGGAGSQPLGLRGKQIPWLKGLPNRFRPSWKPSEEQMGALSWMLENARANIDFDPLKDLYEQLKQL